MSNKPKLPVDLIIATDLHAIADHHASNASLHQMARTIVPDYEAMLADHIARSFLCRIAHNAHLPVVLKALAAAGAPAEEAELLARYRAVREQQTSAGGRAMAAGGQPKEPCK